MGVRGNIYKEKSIRCSYTGEFDPVNKLDLVEAFEVDGDTVVVTVTPKSVGIDLEPTASPVATNLDS